MQVRICQAKHWVFRAFVVSLAAACGVPPPTQDATANDATSNDVSAGDATTNDVGASDAGSNSGADVRVGASDGGGAPGDSGGSTTSCRPLTQWQQKMLDAHNRWRSSVDPPAANMLRVYWDHAIAENAARWVASCDPNWPHSPVERRSNVGGYDVLGENLSYCGGSGCANDPAITDGSGKGDGEGWWDERTDYTLATDTSRGVTSHYTQMVSSNVYAIGCATQRCNAPGPGGWSGEWWWTICQYGPRGRAYFRGTRPYETGSGGLVDPPSATLAAHPGLCRR